MSDLTVIIPTLNEARYLPGLLSDLHSIAVPTEVIVVDGGSHDATLEVAKHAGVRTLSAPQGRATQMNAGAAMASSDWLCFLHADVRMPLGARRELEQVIRVGSSNVAVWRLTIHSRGVWFRLVEFGAWLRDRLGGLPYGDQGLIVRRQLFDAVQGFPEIPIMEDIAIHRALRRRAQVARLGMPLLVSPRRWHREGPYRTWLRNIALISAYLAGVPPERLSRWYRPEPR